MFDKKKFKSYIPQHPFKHGKRGGYDALYFWKDDAGLESALKEYGAIRDPLTDAERQILIEAFGTLKPGEIRRHLTSDFAPAQIENLTWDDVVYHAQNKIKVGQTCYSKETDTSKINAEWSKPMSKSRMMQALGIDSEHTFNAFAERIGIRRINRKTFQLRIDDLGSQEREKLEKA